MIYRLWEFLRDARFVWEVVVLLVVILAAMFFNVMAITGKDTALWGRVKKKIQKPEE